MCLWSPCCFAQNTVASSGFDPRNNAKIMHLPSVYIVAHSLLQQVLDSYLNCRVCKLDYLFAQALGGSGGNEIWIVCRGFRCSVKYGAASNNKAPQIFWSSVDHYASGVELLRRWRITKHRYSRSYGRYLWCSVWNCQLFCVDLAIIHPRQQSEIVRIIWCKDEVHTFMESI